MLETRRFCTGPRGGREPKVEWVCRPGLGPLRSHRISDSLAPANTDACTFEGRGM
jgi:hypothetical protein